MTEVLGSNRAPALNSPGSVNAANVPNYFGGWGVSCGDPETQLARTMVARNGGRWIHPTGAQGDPTYIPPWTEVVLAQGVVDARIAGGQQLTLQKGLLEVEFTRFIFRRFSAQPTAVLKGGLYAAEPVEGVNQAGAMLLADTNTYTGGYGAQGLTTVRKDATPELRTLNGIWWCSGVISDIPLTFEVIGIGIPTWNDDYIALTTG